MKDVFEIPLERRFPFTKELLGPYHTQYLKDASARPAADEIVIDSSWRIITPAPAHEQIKLAAKDLSEFLRVSMRLDIKIGSKSKDPAKEILIRANRNRVKRKDKKAPAESFLFAAGDRGIEITGIDMSGAMYGAYHLENLMRFREAPFVKRASFVRKPLFHTRIFRSVISPYYHDELYDDTEYYTDNILSRISHHGFNGIWIHAILKDIAPRGVFPEFGKGSAKRIAKLKRVITKAARYGIKVYLYFTEPYGLHKDDPFWIRHPEVKGEPGVDFSLEHTTNAFCTSTRPVKRFLEEGMYELFSRAKGLAGVILITASEHHHHCYSHVDLRNALNEDFKAKEIRCPRCRKRTPEDVISELVDLIRRGAGKANPRAKIIAWNWSWSMYEKDPQRQMIEAMPKNVAIMGGFERGAKVVVEGLKKVSDEYSLAYVGPSERFQGLAGATKKAGRDLFAKIQIPSCQECLVVPYFPVMQKICKKFENLRKWGVGGIMECWNFGNFPAVSTEIANEMSWQNGTESASDILLKYAGRLYGKENAGEAVKAWEIFSKATDHYPLDMKFFYWSPLNWGAVVYPFFLEKMNKRQGCSWIPGDTPGDVVSDWTCNLGVGRTLRALGEMADRWEKGVKILEELVQKVSPDRKKSALRDWAVAKAFMLLCRSTANNTRFLDLRDRRLKTKDEKKKKEMYGKMKAVCLDELKIVEAFTPLIKADSRIGFHAELQGTHITAAALKKKKKNLQAVIGKINKSL